MFNWTWKKCLGAAILLSPFAAIFVTASYTVGIWGAIGIFAVTAIVVGLIFLGTKLFSES